MRKSKSFISCLVILWFSSTVFGADYQAKVIHISDGDIITIVTNQQDQVKIRLHGIDCLEKAQAYGNKAKQFTKDLVHGKMVTIQAYDQDKYGRTIGDVILGDGRNLSQELVRAGYAWWYFKYSDDEQLGTLEVKAKIAKVGLWREENPIPSWIFRHRTALETLVPNLPEEPSVGILSPPGFTNPLAILGNKRSQKYHRYLLGRLALKNFWRGPV